MAKAVSMIPPVPQLPPCGRCEVARERSRIAGWTYQNMNELNRAKYMIDGEALCGRHAQQKALTILLQESTT